MNFYFKLYQANHITSKKFSGGSRGFYFFLISLVTYLVLIIFTSSVWAGQGRYIVDIAAPEPLDGLLKKNLEIVKWRDNPRMSPTEWLRLYHSTPSSIKELLATEGYFSPVIKSSIEDVSGVVHAHFMINPGSPSTVSSINLKFTGDIAFQNEAESSRISNLRQNWLLQPGSRFRQDDWSQAKRKLLTALLIDRYPNASVKASKAEVDPKLEKVALTVEIDSGPNFQFGNVSIEGLERYPSSIIENLNPIKPGSIYNQSQLQVFQSRLEESGFFSGAEVTADTTTINVDGVSGSVAPIKVVVQESQSIKVGVGAGYSTNIGARTQLTFDDLNLLDRGWRLTSGFKLAQKEQTLGGLIRLPVDNDGNRDSISGSLERAVIEGQTTESGLTGVNRSWGPRKREQTVGLNYLLENQSLTNGFSDTKWATTVSYGITLRNTDNDRDPTRGYLLNIQLASSPIKLLSSGRFLQSHIKAQGYYPVTRSTQLIARIEGGMVSGLESTPEGFLFRAGGDQSVRGYAYESLGVKKGSAIVGGRYLATGSFEIVQWLTSQWGTAAFVDFGNASNRIQDLKPVYGYGMGLRWKSPIGPIGADFAYGQETKEYHIHFNLGVSF